MAALDLEILRVWTGWFCHGLPERSPQLAGLVFPVCFRCAGIELGLAAGYLGMTFSRRWRGRFPRTGIALALVAIMTPMMIDGVGNLFGWWASPGWWRAATGFGVGLAAPWLLVPLTQPLETLGKSFKVASLSSLRQLLVPAVGGVVAIWMLDGGGGQQSFRLLAFLGAAAWLFFLAHFSWSIGRVYGVPAARKLARSRWTADE